MAKLFGKIQFSKLIEQNSKLVVFEVLFFISLIGTTFLFSNFSDEVTYRIYWVATGIGAVEFFRIYLLKAYKAKLQEIKKTRFSEEKLRDFFPRVVAWLKISPLFIVYVILALVSLTATISVSISTIEQQSVKAENSSINSQKRSLEFQIRTKERQLETYQKEQSDLGYDVAERIGQFNPEIEKMTNDISSLYLKLGELEQSQEFVASNIFVSLADKLFEFNIKTTGDAILLILMTLMAISIELGIFFTTTAPKQELTLKESRYKLFAFIDALMDISSGRVRLNGENVIAEKTGFDRETIRKYKDLLMSTHFRGKPLLVQDGKILKANFSKISIQKIIETKADLE